MYKISNVKVSIKAQEKEYKKIVSSHLNIREKYISNIQLLKRSVDARKGKVQYICTFGFECLDETLLKGKQVSVVKPYQYIIPNKIISHTLVVGSGPAGLFCAWLLAKSGSKVTLIERGYEVEKRSQVIEQFFNEGIFDEKSNVQFGEGGAGTFSDGKLTTGIKDDRVRQVLETFVYYGAPKSILVDAKPHIGTDYLRIVVKNMREDLIKMGAQVLFETQMTDIKIEDNQVKAIEVNHQRWLSCDQLVLAIGHSARDTFELLYHKQFLLEQKPFSVGFRIEHPQSMINEIQYHQDAKYLKAADYKLSYHTASGRGVYTFCMCPGGQVVGAASEKNRLVTNGMSYYARDKDNANAAILVNVGPQDFQSDHPLAGMYYQQNLEHRAFVLGGSNYHAPISLFKDYKENTISQKFGEVLPTYQPGVTFANLNDLLSTELNEALKEGITYFGSKLKGFDRDDALLTAIESRSSSPIRILRDGALQSNFKGIYPCGEGAGYAGGIMSAAIDGLKVAEMILKEA